MCRDLDTGRTLAVQVVTVAQIGQLYRIRGACGEEAIQVTEYDGHAVDAAHLTCVDFASYVPMRRLRSLPEGGAVVTVRRDVNYVWYYVGCDADVAGVVTWRDVEVDGRGARNGRLLEVFHWNASFNGFLKRYMYAEDVSKSPMPVLQQCALRSHDFAICHREHIGFEKMRTEFA